MHNRSHSLYQLTCGDWLLVYQKILLSQLSCSSDQHPVKRDYSLHLQLLMFQLNTQEGLFVFRTKQLFIINNALFFNTCSQDPFHCTLSRCVWLLVQLCARSVHRTIWTSVSSQLPAQLHLMLQKNDKRAFRANLHNMYGETLYCRNVA